MLESLELTQLHRKRGGLRGAMRQRLLDRAFDRAAPLEDDVLMRSTVVIAPHYDDETLGCGGTLLQLGETGADRHVIFMTDGSVSHRDWIDPVSLRRSRQAEGYAAAAQLGLRDDQVHCLQFPETDLFAHLEEAVGKVRAILERVQPQLVMIPYRHEPPPDHRASYEIGIRAMQSLPKPIDVLEYPIWVWDAWPFTTFEWRPWRRLHRRMQENWRLVNWTLRDMRTRVDIRNQRAGKLAALNKHRTQMARPDGQEDWPTLADVKDGDFLDLFFAPYELFHRTTLSVPAPLAAEVD